MFFIVISEAICADEFGILASPFFVWLDSLCHFTMV